MMEAGMIAWQDARLGMVLWHGDVYVKRPWRRAMGEAINGWQEDDTLQHDMQIGFFCLVLSTSKICVSIVSLVIGPLHVPW
jgi:hypothetical protein